MKRFFVPTAAASLLCALAMAPALAQYKYIGPDGRVVYSDTPPPPTAKPLAKPAAVGNVAAASGAASSLPFALQGPTKNFPVVLYTTADCDVCNQGRRLLNTRGIPFAEKTVRTQEDMNAFKAATASSQVPVLMVGTNKQMGFDESAWNIALNSAGYPTNNQLPPGYKNPAPASAAPAAATAAVAPPPAPKPQAEAPAPEAPPAPSGPPSAPANKPPTWFKGF